VKIEAETNFVDAKVLAGILEAKTKLDGVGDDRRAFNFARARANPYEGIKKEFFMNRAAVKMAAIDAACDHVFSLPGVSDAPAVVARRTADEAAAVAMQQQPAPEPPPPATPVTPATRGGCDGKIQQLFFCDVAAGPGGFSEYLLWRRGPSAKGIGFTLKGDQDFTRGLFHHRAVPEAFHPYYGPEGHGDLYSSKNLCGLVDLVRRQTKGRMLHLVMADGGFDVSKHENIQEILNKQLLLTQCIVPIATLQDGGNFICKCFDLFTPFSASLLYLLHLSFEKICIYKPAQSRPANSERYILCRGFRSGAYTEDLVDHLISINDRLNEMAKDWKTSPPGDDVLTLVPIELMQASPFGPYLTDSNNRLGSMQIRALMRLVACIHNPSAISADQSAVREVCLAQWGLPHCVAKRNDWDHPEQFFLHEIEKNDSIPRRLQTTALCPFDVDPNHKGCRLRWRADWVVVEAASVAPPVIVMGADGNGLGMRGIAMQFARSPNGWEWLQIQGLWLPRGTLLLAEVVEESVDDSSGARALAVHAVDAAMLAGDDVRRLSYKERRQRLEILVHSLGRDGEIVEAEKRDAGRRGVDAPAHTPLRLKDAWSLDTLGSALAASAARRQSKQSPQWEQHGVLLFPGHGHAWPLPEPQAEWSGPHFSQTQQVRYWQNKRTCSFLFERDLSARPTSFRNCATSLLRWERNDPREVSEDALRRVSEQL